MKKQTGNRAFTLIELLVVISIIGLLSSVVLASLNGARQKARVAKRLSDLHQIQLALENYYSTSNGVYPISASWRSQCSGWGGYTQDQVIPGFVPTYMSVLPGDPSMNTSASANCYLYRSDGTGADYKFMIYSLTDMTQADINKFPVFVDPQYTQTMSIYSSGGINFR